jgi:hypothetical protein
LGRHRRRVGRLVQGNSVSSQEAHRARGATRQHAGIPDQWPINPGAGPCSRPIAWSRRASKGVRACGAPVPRVPLTAEVRLHVSTARRFWPLVLLLAGGCESGREEPKLHATVVCAKFSFRAAGRDDVDRARRQFYEAALQMKANAFSDSSSGGIWPKTHARLDFGGGGYIVLGGSSDYPDRPDPHSSLTVYWFDQGSTYAGATSTPCTWPDGRERFARVRSYFTSWELTDDNEVRIMSKPTEKK